MDHIPNDLKEFIELLNANGVEYVIVGGHAMAYYGVPRFTKDIDFFVRASRENAKRIMSTMSQFGFESLQLSEDDFLNPEGFIQLGYAPNRIDLLMEIDGVSFDEAWLGRQTGTIGGVHTNFIGRKEFLANKAAAGRPRDISDIQELESS